MNQLCSLDSILEYNFSQQPVRLVLIAAHNDYVAINQYVLEQIKTQHKHYNIIQVDVDKNSNFDDIVARMQSNTLFSECYLVWLSYKTKPNQEQLAQIINLCNNVGNQHMVVISTGALNHKERNEKWVTSLLDYGIGTVIDNSSIPHFIRHYLHSYNLRISNSAITLLNEQNQNNFAQLAQELNTIALYYAPGTEIHDQQVLAISTTNSQYDIYKLSQAYLSGNLALSINILENLLSDVENSILISWIIYEDLKKLLKTKDSLRHNADLNSALRQAGVWSNNNQSFANAIKRLNYTKLLQLYDQVAQLDMITKGLVKKDISQHLRQIVLQISKP